MEYKHAIKQKLYVGVCGIAQKEQVNGIVNSLPETMGRKIGIGVLLSGKSLRGLRYSYTERYPKREDISSLFSTDPRVINVIHYNTSTPGTLEKQLHEILSFYRSDLHGIQLNMVWPNRVALANIKAAHPHIKFLMQVSPHRIAQKSSEKTTRQIVDRLVSDYNNVADYLLVDWSRGRGKDVDIDVACEFLNHLSDAESPFTLGIAGGLCAETFERCEQLLASFPNLCFDAEGRLRTKRRGGVLDVEKAQAFIDVVLRACRAA